MEAGTELATRLKDDPRQRHAIIRALVARVGLSEGAVRIDPVCAALRRALEIEETGSIDEPYTITVPARRRARGLELRFVTDGPDSERLPAPDPSLIKAIVRAHDWFQRLLAGEASTLADIAKAEGVNDRYVRRIIQLASLAPDITAAILDGHQPIDLTAERLTNIPVLPVDWAEQRKLLGFA